MYVSLRRERNKDNAALGAGLLLFWPVLFFIDGDSPDAQTYARLKGEVEAFSSAYAQKNC